MGASGARRLFICLQSLMNIFQALLCLSAAFLSADFTLGLAFRIASVIPFWVISILIPYEKVLVDGLRYHIKPQNWMPFLLSILKCFQALARFRIYGTLMLKIGNLSV